MCGNGRRRGVADSRERHRRNQIDRDGASQHAVETAMSAITCARTLGSTIVAPLLAQYLLRLRSSNQHFVSKDGAGDGGDGGVVTVGQPFLVGIHGQRLTVLKYLCRLYAPRDRRYLSSPIDPQIPITM